MRDEIPSTIFLFVCVEALQTGHECQTACTHFTSAVLENNKALFTEEIEIKDSGPERKSPAGLPSLVQPTPMAFDLGSREFSKPFSLSRVV